MAQRVAVPYEESLEPTGLSDARSQSWVSILLFSAKLMALNLCPYQNNTVLCPCLTI
jgi:hypothetical protein